MYTLFYFLRFKFQFIELTLEMQNEECKMQNCCIFFENDFNQSAKPTHLFCILHSAFCIRAAQLPDKHQFESSGRKSTGGDTNAYIEPRRFYVCVCILLRSVR